MHTGIKGHIYVNINCRVYFMSHAYVQWELFPFHYGHVHAMNRLCKGQI